MLLASGCAVVGELLIGVAPKELVKEFSKAADRTDNDLTIPLVPPVPDRYENDECIDCSERVDSVRSLLDGDWRPGIGLCCEDPGVMRA